VSYNKYKENICPPPPAVQASAMAPSVFLAGLLQLPWPDLAARLITKDELREAGWSEAKIKLHLGEPKGRHPSTHFQNPLGQPYWTGQQVLSAAVRGGYISAELKDWPYQVPVHGLTASGRFIMALEQGGRLVMHPALEVVMRNLVHVKAELASLAVAKPLLGERNLLAEPGLGLGSLMIKHFNVTMQHFPPSMPADECLDYPLWVEGKPSELAQRIEAFCEEQQLLAELQVLATEQDVIDTLAEDIASKENRYVDISTEELAELCGVSPADGDACRTTYAYWQDLDGWDQHHERMGEMEPYVSPSRWKRFERWIERIEEGELEFEDLKLTPRELEIIELLLNQDGYEDRSYLAVCTHCFEGRNGQPVNFQYFVGDGGDIEDSSGPYHFSEPEGINCDEDLSHPKTGKRLCDLLYKPRKPKAK
jgi:hypothetical protein